MAYILYVHKLVINLIVATFLLFQITLKEITWKLKQSRSTANARTGFQLLHRVMSIPFSLNCVSNVVVFLKFCVLILAHR